MGAQDTSQVAAGKTAGEAYHRAHADAQDYYGHQEGYSGAINSKDGGYVLVDLPPRFTYAKLEKLIQEYDYAQAGLWQPREAIKANSPGGFYFGKRGAKGNLRKAQVELRRAEARIARVKKQIPPALAPKFDSIVETYNDKWGPPLAVELKGAEAKRYRTQKRRGEKLFVFFGMAPS